jgi:uncharacterized protein (TIGR00106 family)
MLLAFSVSPLGSSDSVGEAVAEAVRIVRASGLPSETTSMFTTIEGEWDEVMDVVKRATEAVAAAAPRVSLVIKADIRPGVVDALHSKVATVEQILDRSVEPPRGVGAGLRGARSGRSGIADTRPALYRKDARG